MDLRTGEIKDFKDISKRGLKHFIEIEEKIMTESQKEKRHVSLKDHKSKLGKLLTKKRKDLRYSQMSKNKKRNLRRQLKDV